MAAWYERLSCYAYPSSGEGWSFTPRESLYLEIPTILTDIPPPRELAASGYCTVIPTNGVENAETEWGTFGTWAGIRSEDIKNAIYEVFTNQVAAKTRAIAGSRWIAGQWRNSDMESQLAEFLESL